MQRRSSAQPRQGRVRRLLDVARQANSLLESGQRVFNVEPDVSRDVVRLLRDAGWTVTAKPRDPPLGGVTVTVTSRQDALDAVVESV